MSLFTNILPTFTRTPATACVDGAACNSSEASVIRPAYRVQETPEAYRVTVNLPGVAKDGLELTAEGDEVRITGRRSWTQPEGWTALHRETRVSTYELVLTHDNAIDGEKIAAELRDGVLSVTLPKAEAVKPRKIAVA
jgi:HSP20 family protein